MPPSPLSSAWQSFLDAAEIEATVAAFDSLREACGVPSGSHGQAVLDAILDATSSGTGVPQRLKSLMAALSKSFGARPSLGGAAAPRVLISGAGPVGLRAAVEAALMGQCVTVVEARAVFSRVNILMLWQCTADDLFAYGAKAFYPRFTNRHIGDSPLHLGTREIQLVLLKNALLLGVAFAYGTELVALQPPAAADGACWRCWALRASSTETHQTSGGVLSFKPNKAPARCERRGAARGTSAARAWHGALGGRLREGRRPGPL